MAVPSRQALKTNFVCPDLRKGAGITQPVAARTELPRPQRDAMSTTFDELRLAAPLLRALRAEAHLQPTPI